mgnify:CR=1 FL=1
MKFHLPLLLLICCCLSFTGCVSKSVYQQQLTENAHMEEVIRNLQADYEALQYDKKQLMGRNDDLNVQLLEAIKRSGLLQQDLERARADLVRIEKVLQNRSAEAGAALANMRETIDQLTEQNQQMAEKIEEERQAREAQLAEIKGK